jgi:hypothetical protein
MQPKEYEPESENRQCQDNGHDDHEHIRLARCGDESRQMFGRKRMN